MDRTTLKIPDEDLAEEFGRVLALLQRATSKALFKPLMSEAKHRGLNWVEALEYVVDGEGTPKREAYTDVKSLRAGVSGPGK